MLLYKQKQRWKLWLGIVAFIITGATLLYTNFLVRKIASEERIKAQIWAKAIESKAQLVSRSKELFKKFKAEDRKNIRIWAKANKKLVSATALGDITFLSQILTNNTQIPVLIVDGNAKVKFHKNFRTNGKVDLAFLQQKLEELSGKYPPIDVSFYALGKKYEQYLYYDDSYLYKNLKSTIDNIVSSFINETVVNSAYAPVVFTNQAQDSIISAGKLNQLGIDTEKLSDKEIIDKVRGQNKPIIVELEEGKKNYIFYQDSYIINLLRYFPVVFLAIVGAFLVVAYLLFSTARRSEQNLVWVGMSKETAHQLGTPLSSLLGWLEILKSKNTDASILKEIEEDIKRLQVVSQRFSKVGSVPELKSVELIPLCKQTLDYMQRRASKKIQFGLHVDVSNDTVKGNAQLLTWVLENLLRNSIDAIKGDGNINIYLSQYGNNQVAIDVSDTGKGIARKSYKTIFRPGFTSKKRGWGLGLSLTKRIIVQYHYGKIFVKSGNVGNTVIRILLKSK